MNEAKTEVAPEGQDASPWLILDTATAWTQCGYWEPASREWIAFRRTQTPALEALPAQLTEIEAQTKLRPSESATVVINAGPGSILGLRIATMMVAGWQRLQTQTTVRIGQFHGLSLHAQQPGASGDFCLPFRRGIDNVAPAADPEHLLLRQRDNAEIPPSGQQRLVPLRATDVTPEGWERVPHDLQKLAQAWPEWTTKIRWVASPEIYIPEVATFKKWDAVAHTSPSKAGRQA